MDMKFEAMNLQIGKMVRSTQNNMADILDNAENSLDLLYKSLNAEIGMRNIGIDRFFENMGRQKNELEEVAVDLVQTSEERQDASDDVH